MSLKCSGRESRDGPKDLVCGLHPLEGCRRIVVCVQIVADRSPELRDARVRTTTERLGGEQSEEALDEVEPRGMRGGEVQVESGMFEEPAMDGGRLVRGEIVEDDVHLQALLRRRVDLVQERDELLGAMSGSKRAENSPGRDIQRCEQVQRPMSPVGTGLSLGLAELVQDRLGVSVLPSLAARRRRIVATGERVRVTALKVADEV